MEDGALPGLGLLPVGFATFRGGFAAVCLSFPRRVGAVHEGREARSSCEPILLCKHCHTQERGEDTQSPLPEAPKPTKPVHEQPEGPGKAALLCLCFCTPHIN